MKKHVNIKICPLQMPEKSSEQQKMCNDKLKTREGSMNLLTKHLIQIIFLALTLS